MQVYVKVDWQESAEELHARYRAESDPHVGTRLHALWLLRAGMAARSRVTTREANAPWRIP